MQHVESHRLYSVLKNWTIEQNSVLMSHSPSAIVHMNINVKPCLRQPPSGQFYLTYVQEVAALQR